MALTTTEFRQIQTEVKYLAKQKEFSGFLNKITKSFKFWESSKQILGDTKDAYNFALINLCQKYGLDTDGIYVELDKAWDKGNKLSKIRTFSGPSLLQYTFYEYKEKTIEIVEKFARKELESNE